MYIYIYISKNILAISLFYMEYHIFTQINLPGNLWESSPLFMFSALLPVPPVNHDPTMLGGPQWHPPIVGGNSIAVSTGQKDSRVTSRCDEVLVGKCFITSQMAVWNKPPFFPEIEGYCFQSQFQHAIFCLSVKLTYISFFLT